MPPSGDRRIFGSRRAVFLDRDGVVNRAIVRDGKPYPPPDLASFEILPGVPEAIQQIKEHGFLVGVVTNQPDVARGTQRRDVVEAMHDRIRATLEIDDIQVCYDTDRPGCDCYKPKPGMLLETARKFGIDLTASFMVGDRWRDIGAARAAGCTAVFVDRGYSEILPQCPDITVSGLPEAAGWIIRDMG
jgi:D-glycero-D-manno-heptose 1,7-bisphosphate phosphatase